MHVRVIAALIAVSALGAYEEKAAPPQRPAPQVTVVTVQPRTIPYLGQLQRLAKPGCENA